MSRPRSSWIDDEQWDDLIVRSGLGPKRPIVRKPPEGTPVTVPAPMPAPAGFRPAFPPAPEGDPHGSAMAPRGPDFLKADPRATLPPISLAALTKGLGGADPRLARSVPDTQPRTASEAVSRAYPSETGGDPFLHSPVRRPPIVSPEELATGRRPEGKPAPKPELVPSEGKRPGAEHDWTEAVDRVFDQWAGPVASLRAPRSDGRLTDPIPAPEPAAIRPRLHGVKPFLAPMAALPVRLAAFRDWLGRIWGIVAIRMADRDGFDLLGDEDERGATVIAEFLAGLRGFKVQSPLQHKGIVAHHTGDGTLHLVEASNGAFQYGLSLLTAADTQIRRDELAIIQAGFELVFFAASDARMREALGHLADSGPSQATSEEDL